MAQSVIPKRFVYQLRKDLHCKMRIFRYAAAVLAVLLLLVSLPACSGESEIPSGYQYATCAGEYFRFFVPTQWTVNTGSGISGAYITIDTAVSMQQVDFDAGQSGTDSGDDTASDAEDSTGTLEDFQQAYIREIGEMHDYAETDTPIATTVDDYRAILLRYTARVAGTLYKFRQVLCKVEGRFYVYSYSAPTDKYDTYADIAEEIQEEIRFYHTPYEDGAATREIPDDVSAPDGMKLVSTDAVAYRFYVPVSWETDMENSANLVYMTEADGSKSNVTMIGYMPEDDGFSIDDYWDMCVKQYEDALPDFTVLSAAEDGDAGGESGKIGDRVAKLYTYTYTMGGYTYKVRQAVCTYSTMVYTMTYTALEQNFDSHLEDVNAMQEALVFRSPFKKE
jgi:hypothetical protein